MSWAVVLVWIRLVELLWRRGIRSSLILLNVDLGREWFCIRWWRWWWRRRLSSALYQPSESFDKPSTEQPSSSSTYIPIIHSRRRHWTTAPTPTPVSRQRTRGHRCAPCRRPKTPRWYSPIIPPFKTSLRLHPRVL